MSPLYISLAEAARLAGLSRKYLNVLVYRKKIRVEKIGGQWFMTHGWLNDYLRSVRRPEIGVEEPKIASEKDFEPDEFVGAYIQQTRFLQEQFGKLVDDKIAQVIQSPPVGALDNMQRRIDDLQTELHQEQADKQALLFELQHLHEQMEETIQHRLADMADELNRKIMDTKVTEHLERLGENFEQSVIPIESPAAVQLPAVHVEPIVPLHPTPLRRRAKYHALRIWDETPKFKAGHLAVPAMMLAAFLVINFASARLADIGTRPLYFSEVGIRWGEEAVEQAGNQSSAVKAAIRNSEFALATRTGFLADFVASLQAPEFTRGLETRLVFLGEELLAGFTESYDALGKVAGASSTSP